MVKNFSYKLNNYYHTIFHQKLFIIIGSGHRVGSTWIYNLMRDLYKLDKSTGIFPSHGIENGTIKLNNREVCKRIKSKKGYRIFKTHSPPLLLKIVFMIRELK